MAGAIFVNEATAGLVNLLPDMDRDVVVNAIAGTSSDLFEALSEKQQTDALAIIVRAIDNTYILLIAAGALGVLLSVFLKRERLFMTVAAGGA
ncbi:hypothetical protein INS49_006301 [Diaporthe citri]|uniref:uncharacterized protein n=1 Tax=Diaporthe citri TaxID=83186 RepID=UPI001C7F91E6|nr:uncharacterized protein INS49_006301 [Diaporthe citri]KAG6364697.1 hypothetical protein INS49_006301 [Diaporthe citri]